MFQQNEELEDFTPKIILILKKGKLKLKGEGVK